LQASLERIGLGDQLIIYTPDLSVDRELSAMGVRSRRFGYQRVAEWSDYGTSGFGAIAAYKFAVACEILNSGSNVLFIDSDIVFLANPVGYLKDVIEKTSAHLVMQFESPKAVYNTGFWYASPDPSVIRLFRDIQHRLLVDKSFICDQKCFNAIIPDNKDIKVHILDVKRFACGNQFLDIDLPADESIDLSFDPFPFESAYLLHFNYLVGKKRKVAAINEHNVLFYPPLLNELNEKSSLWSTVVPSRSNLTRLVERGIRLKQKLWTAIKGEPIHRWPQVLARLWRIRMRGA
jgi:hypothetical protein